MNETTEEKNVTEELAVETNTPKEETALAKQEKKPDGDEKPAGRWKKWLFVFLTAATLVNVVTNMFALMKLFDIRRVFLILVWLIAAVCFGITAFSYWKDEKKQETDNGGNDHE